MPKTKPLEKKKKPSHMDMRSTKNHVELSNRISGGTEIIQPTQIKNIYTYV